MRERELINKVKKETKNGSERGFHLKLSWSIVQKQVTEKNQEFIISNVRMRKQYKFMNIPYFLSLLNILLF